MSYVAESSSGRRQSEANGEETGLPLVQCPDCGKAMVIERRSKKENANLGRVYFKCPRNLSWLADSCGYYRWQRQYFDGLVESKVIQVCDPDAESDLEIEEKAATMGLQDGHRAQAAAAGMLKAEMEAKVEKLMKIVMVLVMFMVAFAGMFVGYVLK